VFGHPHAPELDADFGDFASLVEHMQANAAAAGEEFFLFDSGDLIEVLHDTHDTRHTRHTTQPTLRILNNCFSFIRELG
jgi:hypothetical protein